MTPRPALLLTLAYGAGLATGLLRFGDPVPALLVLASTVAWAAVIRRPLQVLLAVATTLGRGSGELAWVAEAGTCAARLPAGRISLAVRLREPAPPEGGRLEVAPVTAACRGTVAARWPRGDPRPAGITTRVEAAWVPRPGTAGRAGGTLVVAGAGSSHGAPSASERLRTIVARSSRALYGARAPLVDALMLGRRGGIDRELQDRFAQSGLVHLLSISGFHVGLIGAWVFLVARLLRARREHALVIAALVSAAYVGFLGWPAPATRAAALAAVLARCRVRQRHVRGDELLAATCLAVLLIDPWAALDLGGWLSAAASAGGRWARRSAPRWPPRRSPPGRLVRWHR